MLSRLMTLAPRVALRRTLAPASSTVFQTRTFSDKTWLTDEDIAKAAEMNNIADVANSRLGMDPVDLHAYGPYKAKISVPKVLELQQQEDKGKLILVTAMSPTKAGEGKTCTCVGLADGLAHIGKNVMVTLREPSLGPVFGVKGGAAGGGYAQIVPMDEINLHFTGDLHAITTAHNLLSAMLDNHIFHRNEPKVDIRRVNFKRVLDMNDRALRKTNVGLGGHTNGYPREDGFDITVASEVMAIFCLAQNLQDLQERLGNIIVGYVETGKASERLPVTCRDIKADGAMTALLRDALQPNLVQTLEHNPAFVHGGPFANIAHGCSSVISTQLSLKLADYVVTEAGFGADLGAEKFFDIKCRKAGLKPSVTVVVGTVRALKLHGGLNEKDALAGVPDVNAVRDGLPNLLRHIENVRKFKVPVVVALNKFPLDTDEEVEAVISACADVGVKVVLSDHWAKGGAGAADLASAVVDTIDTESSDFSPLYPDEMPLVEKIETVAKEIYRAGNVTFEKGASTKLRQFTKLGYGHFPVCMAKTQYSFSDNAAVKGAPDDHTINVRDVRLSAGAEFVVALTGDIMTMPGLPKAPAAEAVGVDEKGDIYGLF